jgi:hypothetical protein
LLEGCPSLLSLPLIIAAMNGHSIFGLPWDGLPDFKKDPRWALKYLARLLNHQLPTHDVLLTIGKKCEEYGSLKIHSEKEASQEKERKKDTKKWERERPVGGGRGKGQDRGRGKGKEQDRGRGTGRGREGKKDDDGWHVAKRRGK